jgi:hypothetical protein
MTFAVGFFGVVGISGFGTLAFLIVAPWRKDRSERLSNPRREGAAGQNISLPREWDPLAELLENPQLRRD